MKIRPMLIVVVAGLALAVGGVLTASRALGVEPMPANFVPPEQRNAAIRYLFAIAAIEPDMHSKIGLIDWKEIGDNVDPAKMPQSFKDVAALSYPIVIQEVTAASRMPRCNFETNYEAGVNALLPQLGYMRQLGRILRFDARLLETQGKSDEAADRLLTMLRLAWHVRQDGWFISVLVSAAIDKAAFDEIAVLSRSAGLSPAKREELLAALQTRDIPDPLNFTMAIDTERKSIVAGLKQDAARPDGAKIISKMLDEKPDARIAALSKEDLQRQIALLGPMYDQFALALSPETTDEQAEKIQARVKAGEFGLLSAVFMPGVDGIRKNRETYKANLASAIAAMRTPVTPKR